MMESLFKKIEFRKNKSEDSSAVLPNPNETSASQIIPGFNDLTPTQLDKVIADKLAKGEISEIPFSEN